MSSPKTPWERLAAKARQAPDTPANLPHGFATRVVARAFAQPQPSAFDLLGFLAYRALGYAAAIAVTAAVISYPSLSESETISDSYEHDPVAEILSEI